MVEMQKHLILGTAGHVDHGKTALIKAMTGIDTDRLKEEKQRGLTIDLGFAWLELPSGILIGIVDVPGHEKFLKNMLAGATGIDIALLVVAADEGVMPQTKEHVQILELLETKNGLVALTKTDTVHPDWLDLVEEELRRYLQSTFLRDASIVRVSAVTGEGIPKLIEEIDAIAISTPQRPVDLPFRMPIDRVFTVSGFGTVVTGTLVSGKLSVGDSVCILPQNIESRARNIQVHGKPQQTAYAGTRVAVNLGGVEACTIERGSVLVQPGYLTPSTIMDTMVRILPESPHALKNGTRVRVHIGTTEAIGRVTLLQPETIMPGESGFAQLRLEKPVVAARGDRFILRLYSPMELLGGGQVLIPKAEKYRRKELNKVLERLHSIIHASPEEIVLDALVTSARVMSAQLIAQTTNLPEQQVLAAIKQLVSSGRILELQGKYIARASYLALKEQITSSLARFHATNPLRLAATREEIRTSLETNIDPKDFNTIVTQISREGEIAVTENTIRLPNHSPKLSDEQKALVKKIEDEYLTNTTSPPLISDIEKKYGTGTREILTLLIEEGVLVKITPEILFHQTALRMIESLLTDYLKKHGQVTVAEVRDLLKSSRKYVVPLLEYFDTKRITTRRGDYRILARSKN